MLLRNIPVFGLHVLLFLHTSRCFVLLTANIEDVKKIAKKFVSESLADKIAGFIASAAQNIKHKSEEVHKDVSEENEQYNIKETSSIEQDNFNVQHKKSKKHRKTKKNIEDNRSYSSIYNSKAKNQISVLRANSIENNKVDDTVAFNKTIDAVFDLNLKPEKGQDVQKKIHHRNPQVQLLATSGNMVLTKVINSKEFTDSVKID